MANRFWRGGAGNWNDTAHWSTTSGGAGGASVPGTSDAAIFDQNSGAVATTLDIDTGVASIDFHYDNLGDSTPVVATFDFGAKILTVSGNVTFGNGVIITSTTGGLKMTATAGATFECITSAAAFFGQLEINCPGQQVNFTEGDMFGVSFIYNGHYNIGTFTLTAGTVVFPTANQFTPDVTIATFNSNNSNTRTINFNSSPGGGFGPSITTITVTTWNVATVTGLTLSNALVTILRLTAGGSFAMGTISYLGTLTLLGAATITGTFSVTTLNLGGGVVSVAGANTITTLNGYAGTKVTFNGGSTINNMASLAGVSFYLAPGFTNTWNLTGVNGAYLSNIGIQSTNPGTRATLAITATVTISWLLAQDISVTGGQIVVYRGYDRGNNVNIIFMVGFKKYYTTDVYSPNGSFIGQYTDIVSDPSYAQEVNSPGSPMTLKRGVDPTNYGEGYLVDFNNQCIVNCFSEDAPNGEVIFNGFIGDYTPVMDAPDQFVEIILLPYGDELSQYNAIVSPTKDVDTGFNYTTGFRQGPYDRVAQSWVVGGGITNLSGFDWTPVEFTGSAVRIRVYKDNGSGIPDNTTALFDTTFDNQRNYLGAYFNPGSLYGIINISPAVTVAPGDTMWVVATPVDATGKVYLTPGNNVISGGVNYYTGGAWGGVQTVDTILITYSSTGNTTVPYNTTIQAAMKNVIDNYRIQGGTLSYSSTSIGDTGTSINYTFKTVSVLDAIKKLNDLAPAGWYWYVDVATNIIYFKQVAALPQHYFTMGRDIRKVKPQKTMETVVNTVLVTGGDTGGGVNLYRNYSNAFSRQRYGRRNQNYNDSSIVTTAIADAVAQKIINTLKLPSWRNNALEVLSFPSGGAPGNIGGYHNEALRPGDTFIVMGYVGFIMLQITRIGYTPDSTSLDASTILPQINAAIEDVSTGLEQQQTSSNPSAPTQVAV